ncbi:pollen-specific leucine-rich repeat extensin-like protein 2 [Cornus florida]|uniref:pollen-specific leucine-rich repeat extensin-like protein 2 n=1 Tax=Cornus florida TaxID=4283 RepID=UPI00289D393F|nr:pollen-specific leucine-rich repeat extensin-like protein 2 [Cornus florida]
MESPLLTLLVLSLGVVLSFSALSVESQGNVNPGKPPPTSPPSVQDPHKSSPPPPPHLSPPPSPPLSPSLSPPPPPTPTPPPPPPPPPPPSSPPPPLFSPPPLSPPPPTIRTRGIPLPENRTRSPPHLHKRHNNTTQDYIGPTSEQKLNIGKKIGLMFVGVAAILQVCVVVFLGIKRRQLLKAN